MADDADPGLTGDNSASSGDAESARGATTSTPLALALAEAAEAEAELKLARARTAAARAAAAAENAADVAADDIASAGRTPDGGDLGAQEEGSREPKAVVTAEPESPPQEVVESKGTGAVGDDTAEDNSEGVNHDQGVEDDAVKEQGPRRSRITSVRAAAAVLVVVIVAGVCMSIVLAHRHSDFEAQQSKRVEYVQAARQGLVNILSINYNTASADINKILDNAAAAWKDEFAPQAKPFADVVRKAKVITTATITDAGLEKVNKDGSAQVLATATSKVSNSAGADDEPRVFRVRITVAPVDGDLKVAKMEYIAS
ncbi:hypothetical protein [Gordonia rubripertincta]|uniref:hypothetical protein n=1 Tax=Gordonia rubripertincta TaxID=36822 RepID=UPI000B8D7358|nr:hypothetical protein [Gordonia rubripertincta]ASR03094.1 hypothetical protein GCWB2_11485 [Gordonia rubripertincta]